MLSSEVAVGLCGRGTAGARRAALLRDAGITPCRISDEPEPSALAGLQVLFIAGLSAPRQLADQARALGIIVNVEDVPELCDFHVAACVRRGDLVLAVATGGKVPGLARLIREWLERQFPSAWSEHLEELAQMRQRWRGEGLEPAAMVGRLRCFLVDRGWLK
jgi:precorrin-2 dehydrogenase/sirohydrochlorin ferrochelatase